MIQVAYRIYMTMHAANAFRGDGARVYGGRWNNKGAAVVYVSESRSLAAFEVLVHLTADQVLHAYEVRAVTFEEALVENLDPVLLPSTWQDDPPPAALRAIGDEWVREARSAVLRVPSAVVAGEYNFVLNPAHDDFSKIVISQPEPFPYDPRLIKTK